MAAPALVLVARLALFAHAGGVAAAPSTEVNSAWLPYWDLDDAYRAVVANADLIRTASPFWYVARSCTSIGAQQGAGRVSVVNGLQAGPCARRTSSAWSP